MKKFLVFYQGRSEGRMAKTSEPVLGRAVMQVLASQPNGEASVRTLIQHVPDYVKLTAEDHEPSGTRPPEEMWEQRVRNQKSHDKTPGNVIAEGFAEQLDRGVYRLTPAGHLHLKNQGLV
jgi:hypothetical protein